jgi:hypothetical protein
MNTPITITPFDILIAFLILAGAVALVLLVICLYRMIKILGKVSRFIDKNSAPLTTSIEKLPEITENVSVVSKNMTGITETAGDLLIGLDSVAGSDSLGEGGILGTITVIVSVVQNIIQFFRNLSNKDD